MRHLKSIFKKFIKISLLRIFPEIRLFNFFMIKNVSTNCVFGKHVKIYPTFHISDTVIGDYTYCSCNSYISNTQIGKFCSIGPNFLCGWGIHPTNGISTSPFFYSTKMQLGISIANEDKIEERKRIFIGNDVFIGANVTVLDGVTIGDGAIIGAGAVVSKDIEPYSIAVGCPIRIVKKRFSDSNIQKLRMIECWNFHDDRLKMVETYFFDVDAFIEKITNNVDV